MKLRQDFCWEDPPSEQQHLAQMPERKHGIAAALLKSKPGEWGRIGSYSSLNAALTMASHVRAARLAAYAPAGHFEAVGRLRRGTPFLYARYVGDQDA